MSKYEPLREYMEGQTNNRFILQMEEIEQIIGEKLPPSARSHAAWWSNGMTHHHPQCRAWMDNGYRSVNVKDTLRKGYIEFEK